MDRIPTLTATARLDPDRPSVGVDCSVVRQYDAEAPPRVRVELTARASVDVESGPIRPFSAVRGESGDQSLLLIPDRSVGALVPEDRSADGFVPAHPISGCWTATTDVFLVKDVAALSSLASGDSVANTYAVLDHPTNDSCFPTGTYRFVDRVLADERLTEWVVEIGVD